MAKSMSTGAPWRNEVRLRTEGAQLGILGNDVADFAHFVALAEVAAKRGPGMASQRVAASSRPQVNVRDSMSSSRTYMLAWLTPRAELPDTLVSTWTTPGTARTFGSMARIISSIEPMLTPSGAAMRASNSPSSTSVGM